MKLLPSKKRRRKMNEGSTSTLNYWTHRSCNSLRSTLTMLIVSKRTFALCEEQTRELQKRPHLKLGKYEQVFLQLLKGEALPKLWDSMGQDPESIAVIPDLERRKKGVNGPTDFPLLPPQHLNGGVKMLHTL